MYHDFQYIILCKLRTKACVAMCNARLDKQSHDQDHAVDQRLKVAERSLFDHYFRKASIQTYQVWYSAERRRQVVSCECLLLLI